MRAALVGGALLLWAARGWAGELETLRGDIQGSDDQKAEAAARRLGELADPKAVDVVLDGLAIGAPPPVQATLLAALAGKKDPRAVEVLKHYAKNRNPELRKKSLVALAELPDARALPTLLEGLSDSVADVRSAAAQSLGKRLQPCVLKKVGCEDRPVIEGKLVKLMQHQDEAGAKALAQIGTPETARKMGEMIGQVPDALLCTALGDMIKRPDFGPEPIRLEVVKTLAKLPGVDSTTALVEYVGATEKDKQRPSRIEAQKIIDQRSSQ